MSEGNANDFDLVVSGVKAIGPAAPADNLLMVHATLRATAATTDAEKVHDCAFFKMSFNECTSLAAYVLPQDGSRGIRRKTIRDPCHARRAGLKCSQANFQARARVQLCS